MFNYNLATTSTQSGKELGSISGKLKKLAIVKFGERELKIHQERVVLETNPHLS